MTSLNYVEPPNSNLICCICHAPFTHPTTTKSCMHTFCHDCIVEAVRHSPQCPVDRSPLTMEDLTPANPIVKHLVDELIVECPLRSAGCSHTCQRQLLEDHMKNTCQYGTVPRSQDGCNQRRDRGKHADVCVHRTTECDGCGASVEYSDLSVASEIQEYRYLMFCPTCILAQLDVREEPSQIQTEMELAEFAVQIYCRECQRRAYVDREDYSDAVNIDCPQQDCHHVWCKECGQTIVVDGPRHSCDGTSEMTRFMKESGCKFCPNCSTLILKEHGCHHMTCIAPRCNTHFCFVCGDVIVRSALDHEIEDAVSVHFSSGCLLFEVPD